MQLGVGHAFFKSYPIRLPNYIDNRCFGDCHLIQSPEHLLLVCKHYRQKRIEFKKSIGSENFTYPLYANCTLIEFIRQTGISTRGWLINQGQLIDWIKKKHSACIISYIFLPYANPLSFSLLVEPTIAAWYYISYP
jgi:hypothetical protein